MAAWARSYEGVHRETGEPAALKLLSPALAQEEGFRSRFEAEIETLRKLNHPNIVRLFGFGEQDGQLYYAMELVDGNSLEEDLRRGRRFGWQEVTRIGIEICRALRHAPRPRHHPPRHQAGQPADGGDGRVKLSDFGIARLFGNTRLTSPGNVLGTAEYMAPEQAEGAAIDGRADLYSLGTLMYALLARPAGVSRQVAPRDAAHAAVRAARAAPKACSRRTRGARTNPGPTLGEGSRAGGSPTPTFSAAAWNRCYKPWRPVPRRPPPIAAGSCPTNRLRPSSSGGTRCRNDVLPSPESDRPGRRPALYASFAGDGVCQSTVGRGGDAGTEAHGRRASRSTRGHFVLVAEEELDQPPSEEPRSRLFSLRTSWQTWVLATALLAVGLTIRWFLQPLTADALYHRIDARATDPSPDALPQAEADIHEFLNRFPSDPRAAQLRGYENEIDLYWLEKRFHQRVKGLAGTERLRPIEQAYLEALNYLDLDTARGMAKLQAMVDLYKNSDDATGPTAQCLTLVHRRLGKSPGGGRKTRRSEQLRLLRQRLDTADVLRPHDPERAGAMYRAVVELYGDKLWAADAVRRAREALAEKPSQKP